MLRLVTVLILAIWTLAAPVRSLAQDAGVVDRIRTLYQDLQYEEAERRALRAIDNADVYDVHELAELHALLALIYFVQQNEAQARAEFLTALSLEPDLVLDPVLVPPRAMTFFDALREEAARDSEVQIDRSRRYILLTDPRPAAAMRSALLPGWGQRYKKEDGKGWAVTVAYLATTSGSVAAHLARSSDDESVGTSSTLSATTVRDVLIVASAGIWLYGYLDALLGETAIRRPLPAGVRLQVSPASGGARIAGSIRF